MYYYEIILPININFYLTYSFDEILENGTLVIVELRNKKTLGIIYRRITEETNDDKNSKNNIFSFEKNKIKSIYKVISVINKKFIDFLFWVADYNIINYGVIYKMAISSILKRVKNFTKDLEESQKIYKLCSNIQNYNNISKINLNNEQNLVFQKINNFEYPTVHLLHGVTGSGKTEVYLKIIEDIIKKNGQALILVPEILLTTQMFSRFTEVLGKVVVWHSDVNPKQKALIWHGIKNNNIKVVVGARSALFLSFANLQIIVVDEEHDSSFKQEEGIIYNARDMAVVRSKIENIPIILVSATPSIESVYNTRINKYILHTINTRYTGVKLPQIQIIDMKSVRTDMYSLQELIHNKSYKKIEDSSHSYNKQNNNIDIDNINNKNLINDLKILNNSTNNDIIKKLPILHQKTISEIKKTLNEKKQSLIFINRRGYTTILFCTSCSAKIRCTYCDFHLVYHKKNNTINCHYCNYHHNYNGHCILCGNKDIEILHYGYGVEKVAEEVLNTFPESRIAILASDTINSVKKSQDIINKIYNGDIDIIIGTQIVAKGLNFPKLHLIVVPEATPSYLSIDIRVVEKTYQILHQVIGRAGRMDVQGKVILQTEEPQSTILKYIVSYDQESFIDHELAMRKLSNSPPFSRMALITCYGYHEITTLKASKILRDKAPQQNDKLTIMGPSPAPFYKLRGYYRYLFIIIADKQLNIQLIIKKWLDSRDLLPKTVRIKVDIDPYSFF
ncbi:replication restart helicase PriA [Lyticum sinuosum]|uniref:Replication restart protein PriA n=1 Tax=Lyticum sinuosum TaxID=1332059 RepID=A0AAE4VJZ6_9RICK|nr:primosomal protein N' [Lyticum sinuosum]MDZ5760925.1 Primosomal protein N' [Lyticum sinuosum]